MKVCAIVKSLGSTVQLAVENVVHVHRLETGALREVVHRHDRTCDQHGCDIRGACQQFTEKIAGLRTHVKRCICSFVCTLRHSSDIEFRSSAKMLKTPL